MTTVSQALRRDYASENQTARASDATVSTAHLLSTEIIGDLSAMQSADDANAEASRRLALLSKRRDVFTVPVEMNATTSALGLNDVIAINHSRFGLDVVLEGDTLEQGTPCRIIGISRDQKNKRVTFTVWTRVGAILNLVDSEGDYLLTSDGEHLLAVGQ